MTGPIAFKLHADVPINLYPISLSPEVLSDVRKRRDDESLPAVIAVSNAVVVEKMSAGLFDADDAVVLAEGDWANALLVVLPPRTGIPEIPERPSTDGDGGFLEHVRQNLPDVVVMAEKLVGQIREAGIEGRLVLEGFRWVNRPLNTFTLTVQPRVRNFAFTLYGGADRFGDTDFIKKDQNGYSRGWVRSEGDIPKFVELAKIAYERKKRTTPSLDLLNN